MALTISLRTMVYYLLSAWCSKDILASDEPQFPQACEKLTEIVYKVKSFDFSSAPSGCKYRFQVKHCLTNRHVKSVSTRLLNSIGYFSRIDKQVVSLDDPHCAVVRYSVGVDHSGPEGKICREPFGMIKFEMELVPDCN